MKTSLILPVVIVIFITALAHSSALAGLAEDTAAAIRSEALRPNMASDGRALPLWSSWMDQTHDHLALLEQGHFVVPVVNWWKVGGTEDSGGKNTPLGDAWFEPAIKRARELRVPLVFATGCCNVDSHEGPLRHPSFSELPPEINPCMMGADRKMVTKPTRISPFGPLDPWQELGRQWADNESTRKVQEWYPDPPLLLFLSNNETPHVDWREAEQDFRCPPKLRATKDKEVKRRIVGDAWAERFRALQGAWKAGLTEPWRKAARFVGYNAFAEGMPGWHPDWEDWSLATKDRLSPSPLTWDGGSPSYYHMQGSGPGNVADGAQALIQNAVFAQRELHRWNPDFLIELSIWDGGEPQKDANGRDKREQYLAGLGLTYTPQHCAGFWQYGMWVFRPRIARAFGIDKRRPQFQQAALEAVDRVHRDPVLREWWRKGELVPNSATPNPLSKSLGKYEREDRWFMLETDVNPTFDPKLGIDYSKTRYEVFSFSLTRGGAGARQWLVYAYSPERDHPAVKMKIPRYSRPITVDVPVCGAFYEVDERSGSVRPLPPPAQLTMLAPSVAAATAQAPATPAAPSVAAPPDPASNTAPALETDATYLSDLPEENPVVGLGSFGKNGQMGYMDLSIMVNGKPSPKGLSTHAVKAGQASVRYSLGGQYARFKTEAALHDRCIGKFKLSLTFLIKGDGRELWRSPEVKSAGATYAADVSVAGVQKLELIVDCPGETAWAQTVWVEPRLFKTATPPAAALPATTTPEASTDPQLAALHTAWTTRFDAEANKPFDAAIAALNTSYLRALDTARAAAKNKGALNEVLAIDAEIQQIKTSNAPAADTADTPPALTTLRKTWRDTSAKHATARDTKLTQLKAQFAKALDALIVDLTKANKIDEAKRAQQFRETQVK